MFQELLFPLFFAACLAIEVDFTVEINPAKKECYYETIGKGASVDVEYQVIDGGDLDVHFSVKNPAGQVLISDLRKTENYHRFMATIEGDYQFCIDNTFSRFTEKIVFFELLTDENNKEIELNMDYDMESHYDMKIEDFREKLDVIESKVIHCRRMLLDVRMSESRDRHVAEANFERVNTWSVVHIGVMVVTAVAQVLVVRSLFAPEEFPFSYLNKLSR